MRKKIVLNNDDIENIVNLYVNKKMSAYRISKIYGTSHNRIIKILKELGIETRGLSKSHETHLSEDKIKMLDDDEWLIKKYWDEKLNCKQIAEIIGCNASTVRRTMIRRGIPVRGDSESKIGLMKGEKHPNWQGGLTPLKFLLREYFCVNIVPGILKRDNYTCQCCGATKTELHVHHIKTFSSIVNTIVKEHPEYNPDDELDRLKLYDIVVADKRFLDEENLITLCRNCHYFVIHGYTRNKTIRSQENGSETIPCGSTQ